MKITCFAGTLGSACIAGYCRHFLVIAGALKRLQITFLRALLDYAKFRHSSLRPLVSFPTWHLQASCRRLLERWIGLCRHTKAPAMTSFKRQQKLVTLPKMRLDDLGAAMAMQIDVFIHLQIRSSLEF
ncbi:hypothetical protein SLEP1_g3613 [Rubroshorea leprosula]|uniref:Uncharacterized protein n=1 Tax=Rubroshorea leprosula TaxID=152421 RepID=A0AAV5HS19_9ROSI|nr:hypothetical protein SLEP1_g3613 [Rubroshorea leprosula]